MLGCVCAAPLSAPASGLVPRTDEARAEQLVQTARALMLQGEVGAAAARLDTVTRRYRKTPAAAEAALLSAQLYLENRELDEAFDRFQAVIDKHAASPHYPAALAGQQEAARLALEGYRNAARKGEPVGSSLPPKYMVADMFRLLVRNGRFTAGAPKAQYELACALDQLGFRDEALEEHDRFLKDYPEDPLADDAAFQIANIRFHEAKRGYGEEGAIQSALLGFEYFLTAHPASERSPEARHRIRVLQGWQQDRLREAARLYERLGKKEAAALTLARIIEEFPETPDARELALRAHELRGQPLAPSAAAAELPPPPPDAPAP